MRFPFYSQPEGDLNDCPSFSIFNQRLQFTTEPPSASPWIQSKTCFCHSGLPLGTAEAAVPGRTFFFWKATLGGKPRLQHKPSLGSGNFGFCNFCVESQRFPGLLRVNFTHRTVKNQFVQRPGLAGQSHKGSLRYLGVEAVFFARLFLDVWCQAGCK